MSTEVRFRDVRLPNGIRIHYAEQGPAGGPPLLLLHGYTDSWFSFSRVLPLLGPELRVIVPDQRGHGDSDRPAFGYGFTELARDMIHLLNALEIPRLTVGAHCMGGFVARAMAGLAPERIERLVLISTGPSLSNPVVRDFARAVDALTDPVDVDFIREFQMGTLYNPVAPEFFERVVSESRKLPARVWKGVLREQLDSLDVMPGAVECPATVLWGDTDKIFSRAEQAELVRRVPQARLIVHAGVGHAFHWEAPEIAAEVLAGRETMTGQSRAAHS